MSRKKRRPPAPVEVYFLDTDAMADSMRIFGGGGDFEISPFKSLRGTKLMKHLDALPFPKLEKL